MSVLRQLNILGQMRLDVPHVRSVESSIAADFDVVAGRVTAGDQALVVRGFTLTNFAGGTAATSIQLATADAILYNLNATEAGTFLWVPANRPVETLNPATNPNVVGSFTASQTNYIGLDLIRSADVTTSDLVQFLDPNTLLEDPKEIPLGRTLNYQIVISTTPFTATPNLVPIAKVVTDSQNNISLSTPVVDARNMLFRLGAGGDFPNALNVFAWPQGRSEAASGLTAFQGGDKAIASQKDWNAAIMSRIWELGGGENWYRPTADRNVTMVGFGTVMADGEYFTWSGTDLTWATLRFIFDNSTGFYNDVQQQLVASPGLTNLADGECIYVDLDRTQNRTGGSALVAAKAALATLGPGTIPGARFVIAWRTGSNVYSRDSRWPVGTTFQPATTTALGVVKLSSAASTPSSPIVISDNGGNIHGNITWDTNATGPVGDNGTEAWFLKAVSGNSDVEFGTSSNHPLTIYTNNIAQWQFDHLGNLVSLDNDGGLQDLGIVFVDGHKISPNNNSDLVISDGISATNTMPRSGAGWNFTDGTRSGFLVTSSGHNDIEVGTQSNHPLAVYTNNVKRWTFDASGNLVANMAHGSGQKIEFPDWNISNDNLSDLIFAQGSKSITFDGGLSSISGTDGTVSWFVGSSFDGSNDVELGSDSNHPINFYINGQARWNIDTSGDLLGGLLGTPVLLANTNSLAASTALTIAAIPAAGASGSPGQNGGQIAGSNGQSGSSGAAGAGGKGLTLFGGNGGLGGATFAPGNGGDGLIVTGGTGGNSFGATNVGGNGGDGISATGGAAGTGSSSGRGGNGITGTGGAGISSFTGGTGVNGIGGANGGTGVAGAGGSGGTGVSGAAGSGSRTSGGAFSQTGGLNSLFIMLNNGAHFNVVIFSGPPTSPQTGDLWIQSSGGSAPYTLNLQVGGSTHTLTFS